MKLIKFFPLVLLLFYGCNKGETSTSITYTDVTYSTADIQAKFEFNSNKNSDNVIGICWDTLSNPTISSLGGKTFSLNETKSYRISGLISDKSYYVRSFIMNNNDVLYSEEIRIITIVAPIAPCNTTQNVVNFSNNVNMSYLVDESGLGSFKLRSSSSNGDWLYIKLPNTLTPPKTGIYQTSSSFAVYGTIAAFPSCNFGIEEGNTVYIENLGAGRFIISFCELTIKESSYPCAAGITISGMLKTQ